MWAVRRASNSLPRHAEQTVLFLCEIKFQRLRVWTSSLGVSKLQVTTSYFQGLTIFVSPHEFERRIFYNSSNVFSKLSMGTRNLSSQAGAKSSKSDDDLEDGFSELETISSTTTEDTAVVSDDELLSEPDILDDNHEEDCIGEPLQTAFELSDAETDLSEKKPQNKGPSELFKAIVTSPTSLYNVLNKWVEEGKDLSRTEITTAMLNLRKRRMYLKALQLSKWLETNKRLEFCEIDYASRLYLVAKVNGFQKAESYIHQIPESFRGELIYRALLANCVSSNNLKKAEEVFNKMRDLGFPVTLFSCTQLLLLYKRVDRKKIADVLLVMEKENIKPSPFTYKLLIDAKGRSNDITGMDQVFELMKSEGFEPDSSTEAKAIMAKHYIFGGLNEKAEGVLKEIEGGNLKEHRWVCKLLLPLYASLGKADEVRRVWKVCESNPSLEECVAAIEAWGKLNNVDEAEAVFELTSSKWKKLSSKHYAALLRVYADHKKLVKGKDLVKQMADNGCRIGPLTWDALVKLLAEAGEVEKADSVLQKAVEQSSVRPMFTSFMTVMDQYAKRGDVRNAEKIFHRMRQADFGSRVRQYESLIQTYINAKAPAYGIRDRIKADNVFPHKRLAALLDEVDPFTKTAVSNLLD